MILPASPSYTVRDVIISDSTDKSVDIDFKHPFISDRVIFLMCLRGIGKARVDYVEYTAQPNTILTILPYQIVEKVEESDDFFTVMLVFSPGLFTGIRGPKDFEILKAIDKMPILRISEEEKLNLLRYHSFIIETFDNSRQAVFFEKIIQSQVQALLLEIAALYIKYGGNTREGKTRARSRQIAAQFLDLLKEHYKTRRTVSFYAEKMFITPKYLSAALKKATGKPVNLWIEEAVILGAKILLKSTDLTVSQISDQMNFPNSSYFGRFFKKSTGMTPIEYRES